MEGGAANIVTITLPYTDRLYRASPTPQQRNKKWPYEAGQKISFPYATSDMEMAYDAVAIHESLLNEDGFYNSTNYDNPAGAGMGIGFGSSPFAGGMHPPWFEDRSDQFEDTQEQWIKRWIVRSMNKPIDGIRNGGRFQVNEETEILDEGVRDFMKRRSVISILEKPLREKIQIAERFKNNFAEFFESYDFKPFNRMKIKDFMSKLIFDFLEKYPDGLAEMTEQGFERVYSKDGSYPYEIFEALKRLYPDFQILVDDIKFGRLEYWFERITEKVFVNSLKTKYEHSYLSLKGPEEKQEPQEQNNTGVQNIKKLHDPQLDINLKNWLEDNSSLYSGEIEYANKFSTGFDFIKAVIKLINEKGLYNYLYIDKNELQLEKNTKIMDDIFGENYENYIFATALNAYLEKSEYVYKLFEALQNNSNEWKQFQSEYLNEGIGDFIERAADKVANKAKGAVDVVLTKHSVNKKFKLPLYKMTVFENSEERENVESKVASTFAKYSFIPYPMSTVGQFVGRIIADLNKDINKLAYPDKPETFKKIYTADRDMIIFSIFQNLLENNEDLKKIVIDIGHGNLEKWWRTIFGVRAENEPGEPAIDVPDNQESVKVGRETIIDDKLMARFDKIFSGSDMAARDKQIELLTNPKYEKELAKYLEIQQVKIEEEERRASIAGVQDDNDQYSWVKHKDRNKNWTLGDVKGLFKKIGNNKDHIGIVWGAINAGLNDNGWSTIKQDVINYWKAFSVNNVRNESFNYVYSEFINEINFINEAETSVATSSGFDFNRATIRSYVSTFNDPASAQNNVMTMCRLQRDSIIKSNNLPDLAGMIINIMSSNKRQPQPSPEAQPQTTEQPQTTATAQQSQAQSQEFASRVSGGKPKAYSATTPKAQPVRDTSGRFTRK